MNRLNTLKAAAQSGHWEVVDAILSDHSDSVELLEFARDTIKHFDMAKRQFECDLAASILESASLSVINQDDLAQMVAILMDVDEIDRKNYALFRVACALARHGKKRLQQMEMARVTAVLHVFSCDQDGDVAGLAKSYLSGISNTTDKQAAADYYHSLGLETEDVPDPPGKVYSEHKHNKTHL